MTRPAGPVIASITIVDHGLTFNVVLVENTRNDYGPTVEFYDGTWFRQSQFGQFIADYFARTFADRASGHGLNLYGGEPSWYLSASSMDTVRAWVAEQLAGVAS